MSVRTGHHPPACPGIPLDQRRDVRVADGVEHTARVGGEAVQRVAPRRRADRVWARDEMPRAACVTLGEGLLAPAVLELAHRPLGATLCRPNAVERVVGSAGARARNVLPGAVGVLEGERLRTKALVRVLTNRPEGALGAWRNPAQHVP